MYPGNGVRTVRKHLIHTQTTSLYWQFLVQRKDCQHLLLHDYRDGLSYLLCTNMISSSDLPKHTRVQMDFSRLPLQGQANVVCGNRVMDVPPLTPESVLTLAKLKFSQWTLIDWDMPHRLIQCCRKFAYILREVGQMMWIQSRNLMQLVVMSSQWKLDVCSGRWE